MSSYARGRNRRLLRHATAQPRAVDDRPVHENDLPGAVVARDHCPVEDIALASFHVEADGDLHRVADSEVQQRPVAAIRPSREGHRDEFGTSAGREEVTEI